MGEIDKAIFQFLNDKQNEFLDKQISKNTKEHKKEFEKSLNIADIKPEQLAKIKKKYEDSVARAREKYKAEAIEKYEIKKWFYNAYKKAKPHVTTHPAKFTNPTIGNDISSLFFYGVSIKDGYIKTGNVNLSTKVDVSGNSATNNLVFELYSLLEKKFKDDIKIIEAFENDLVDLVRFIQKMDIDYYLFKDKCINVFYGNDIEKITHPSIKQVYFPITIENKSYHLLSVLTPSMLMFEVKKRIDNFEYWVNGKHIRKVKNENTYAKNGFDEVYDLTQIGFSHTEYTKMGNVSYLNVKNDGISYLLPSKPPKLKYRSIRLPTHDFFRDSLLINSFKESFQELHKLMLCPIKNRATKGAIKNILKFIIDCILERVFKIRKIEEDGWSNAKRYILLPLAQRIWLDDIYESKREEDDEWIDDISSRFSRWILQAYRYSLKDHIEMSDGELDYIRDLVEQAVESDKEFFK